MHRACVCDYHCELCWHACRLLDTDQDSKLRLDELEKAQGIEAQYYDNILEASSALYRLLRKGRHALLTGRTQGLEKAGDGRPRQGSTSECIQVRH